MSAAIKSCKLRGRELEEVREVDPDGRIVVHYRTVDTLGRMLKSGTIDQAMYDAARDFQAAFTIASLAPIRAAPIRRVPGGRAVNVNDRQSMRAVACTRRCGRWAGSAVPAAAASGMSWAALFASGNGRSARAGMGGLRIKGSQGDPDRGLGGAGGASWLKRGYVATTIAACDPELP